MGTINIIFISLLQSNTFSGLIVGQNIITLSKTPSTNEYLRERLSKSTPLDEGTVIMAVQQTAGRGQRGTSWESEPGSNLTFSVLLYPRFLDIRQQFLLNAAISVAVVRALQELTKEALHVKWPNDVLLSGRKVAGILIENQLQGKTWKSAVVGIGINVNQTVFSDSVGQRATSLKIITEKTYECRTLLSRLCHYIGQHYTMLVKNKQENLCEAYESLLFARGEKRDFLVDGNEKVHGKIIGVNRLGRLMVDFGSHQADFGSKEITYVF